MKDKIYPKRDYPLHKILPLCWLGLMLLLKINTVAAEGSKDFTHFPGYRLFLWAEEAQQFKVYARQGEYINVGSSHVGIAGGFINVYKPDGTLYATFDNTGASQGKGIINNNVEEENGPTGGGLMNGPGYEPGVIPVVAGENGIWTVTFEYPAYSGSAFPNLLNGQAWTRTANQPTNRRVVLAWDITVSQGTPANAFGDQVEGRVFSNEYHSIINRNGNLTTTAFYVLNNEGFLYQVNFKDTDPWGFPIFSNNKGITDENGDPIYGSVLESNLVRSDDPAAWTGGNQYLFEPQARERNGFINNKVFFNKPDPDMPLTATTTDIFNNDTHSTWLYNPTPVTHVDFQGFSFVAYDTTGQACLQNALQPGIGGFFKFTANHPGRGRLRLDLNNNGSFTDSIDRTILQTLQTGLDSIFWDGKDGFGEDMPTGLNQVIPFQLTLLGGEIHVMMSDIENDLGGVTIEMVTQNNLNNTDKFYYDHRSIGGPKSGDPNSPQPLPTTIPFTYSNNFGNEKLLDIWTFIEFTGALEDDIFIDILDDCTELPAIDTDNDGIPDDIDIDDDNDGIPDKREYCNSTPGFDCLSIQSDPTGDDDSDGIANYQDPDFITCQDANNDGICDQVPAEFDLDGDNIPNHLDLDSDNDGISDLHESGHGLIDSDGDGVLDGNTADFGQNGLLNILATDPDNLNATENYSIWDTDSDGYLNAYDLDSENDGISDLREAGWTTIDQDNDGMVDPGFGFASNGFSLAINPADNGPLQYPIDSDNDGTSDYVDRDSDNDGINDVAEANLPDNDNDGELGEGTPNVNNFGVANADVNGPLPDFTSFPTNTDGAGEPDFLSLDSDGDGLTDVSEAGLVDPDYDGILGEGTPSVNSFGQPTADGNGNPINGTSDPLDRDGDGILDFQDIDRDNDGITDDYKCETGHPCVDTDGDGIPDVDDLDSDDDGLSDTDECPAGNPCPDSNNNGTDNFREVNCVGANFTTIVDLIQDTTLCEGQDLLLTFTTNGSAGDTLQIDWTFPNGSGQQSTMVLPDTISLEINNVQPIFAGTYTVSVTNTLGCTSGPDSINVNIVPALSAPLISVDKPEICQGENFTLGTNPVSGIDVQYIWLVNSGTGFISLDTTAVPNLTLISDANTGTNVYAVMVEDSGCRSPNSPAIQLTVNQGIAIDSVYNTSSANMPACEGGNVSLFVATNATASYSWTGPNNFVSNQQNPIITNVGPDEAGVYQVEISDGVCQAGPYTTEVFVQEKPEKPILSADQTMVCEGENIILTTQPVGGNVSFNWYRDDGNQIILVSTTSNPEYTLNDPDFFLSGDWFVALVVDGCASDLSDPVSLTITRRPPVSNYGNTTSAANPACEGDAVTLGLDPIPNASYNWTGPNGFTSTEESPVLDPVTIDMAGVYNLLVTVDGCSVPAGPTEVFINEIPATPPLAVNDNTFCSSDDVVFTIPGWTDTGYVFNWYQEQNGNQTLYTTSTSPQLTLTNPDPGLSGTFYVVAEKGGCTSDPSNPEIITINQAPEIINISSNTDSNNPLCEGETLELFTDPIPGATFAWTGPNGLRLTGNNPIITDVSTDLNGIFILTAEANGCRSIPDTIAVFINQQPEKPQLEVNKNELCEGEDIMLSIQGWSGTGYTFQWFVFQNGQATNLGTTNMPFFMIAGADNDQSGIYYVVVEKDGCSSEPSNQQTITVRPSPVAGIPTSNSTTGNAICEGDTLQLNIPQTSGASYTWYSSNGLILQGPVHEIPDAGTNLSGSYWVTVDLNGCTATSDTIQIAIMDKPEPPVLATPEVVCEGEPVTINILNPPPASGLTYVIYNQFGDALYTGNDNSFVLNNAFKGTITATVSNDGCDSDFAVPIELNVDTIPDQDATIVTDLVDYCNTDEIELRAIAPLTGSGIWTTNGTGVFLNPGQNVSIVTDLPAGTASFIWTLSNGACKNYASDTIQISIYDAAIRALDDYFTINAGEVIESDQVLSNDTFDVNQPWQLSILTFPEAGLINQNPDGSFSYEGPQSNFVQDSFQYEICHELCEDICDRATVFIRNIEQPEEECFIPNFITPNNDGDNDAFIIHCLDNEAYPENEILIFNRWGDIVFKSKPYHNDWEGTYRNSPLPPGTYFYTLKLESGSKPTTGFITLFR